MKTLAVTWSVFTSWPLHWRVSFSTPPQKLPVEHMTHNAKLMREVYAAGRKTAQQLLPSLREFIAR